MELIARKAEAPSVAGTKGFPAGPEHELKYSRAGLAAIQLGLQALK